jgi:hypothetical protein
MSEVTAVLIGGSPGGGPQPEHVEAAVEIPSLNALRDAATEARTSLLWLLDAAAEPQEGALAALLDHAPGPAASLPVDLRGNAVVPLMGRVTEPDLAGIIAAVRERVLPLRHTYVTSLLVDRELVLELPPPDVEWFGWYAGPAWAARLFSQRPGVLVPASRVGVGKPPAGSPLHILRVARAARWRRGETLRELHRSLMAAFR